MSNLCYLSWLAHRGLGVEHILIISVIWRVSYWKQELTLGFTVGSVLLIFLVLCVVVLCVFIF
jgi:hypothetical protein